ncbi:MAG: response regulator [bacterium]|nr:response regulator [bacterium]
MDDIEITHEYMRALLRSASKVHSAYNGNEALAQAREMRPDLILMDLRMPVMDGFETTEKLKADPLTAEIPIIAVTAQAVEEDRVRAFKAGAEGFVNKPVNISQFRQAIEAVFASRREKAREEERKNS